MSWLVLLQKFGSFTQSQAAWKDVSDSGHSISRSRDVPNGSNKPFHRDAGAKCAQRNEKNKGGSEVISPHWVQPSGFTLSPLNGQNATGRARMKGNKQADVFGKRMERGRGSELLNFHSRFSEGTEWWIIETWKVIKYGSLKHWGQVRKTPAETEGSRSQRGPAVAGQTPCPRHRRGLFGGSPVVFPLAGSPSPSARASGWIWLQIRPPGGEKERQYADFPGCS